jgi:hypothetical protein
MENRSGQELIDELLKLYHMCEEQCRAIGQIIEKLNAKE